MQLVGLTPADGARQRLQVFGEAAEDLQHRVLVGDEDVAPHGRVGGGDAGEVAEAAGRVLHHLGLGDLLHVGGGADDIVGDQVRQVAGDGQHQVVMAIVHLVDIGAQRTPELRQLADRLDIGLVGPGLGREDHPAVLKQFG